MLNHPSEAQNSVKTEILIKPDPFEIPAPLFWIRLFQVIAVLTCIPAGVKIITFGLNFLLLPDSALNAALCFIVGIPVMILGILSLWIRPKKFSLRLDEYGIHHSMVDPVYWQDITDIDLTVFRGYRASPMFILGLAIKNKVRYKNLDKSLFQHYSKLGHFALPIGYDKDQAELAEWVARSYLEWAKSQQGFY